jgi:chondroitin AC lyase
LPHATEEELDSYAKDVPFEVISNTESVQAVKKDSLNIECYVFYEAASCGIVTAGAPMLVTLISREEGTVIKVCDPTHKLSEAKLIIDKKFTEASYSPRLKALFTEKTEITVDFSGAHGRTFDIILK